MKRAPLFLSFVLASFSPLSASPEARLPEGSFTTPGYPGAVFRVNNGILYRVSYTSTVKVGTMPPAGQLKGFEVKTVKGYGPVRRSALMNALSQVPTDAVHVSDPTYRGGRTRNPVPGPFKKDDGSDLEWHCEVKYTLRAKLRVE